MEPNRAAVVVEQDEEVEERGASNNDADGHRANAVDVDGRQRRQQEQDRRFAVGDAPMGGAPPPHFGGGGGGGAQMIFPHQHQRQPQMQQQHPFQQQQGQHQQNAAVVVAATAAMEPMHAQLAQYEARMRDSAAAFASAAAGAAWAAAHLAQTSSSLQLRGGQQASGLTMSSSPSSTFAAAAAAQSAFEVAAAAATNATTAGLNNNVFGGQQLLVAQAGPAPPNVAGFPIAQGPPAAYQQQQPQLQLHGNNVQMMGMPGARAGRAMPHPQVAQYQHQNHHEHQLELEHGPSVAMEVEGVVDERAGAEGAQLHPFERGRSLCQPPRRQREREGASPRSSSPKETDRGGRGGSRRSHRRDGGHHGDGNGDGGDEEDDGQRQPNKRHQRMARQASSGRQGGSIDRRHHHQNSGHHPRGEPSPREQNDLVHGHPHAHAHSHAHEQANHYFHAEGQEPLPDHGGVMAAGGHTSNKRRHSNNGFVSYGQAPFQRDQHQQFQRPAQFSQPLPLPQPQLQHQQHYTAQQHPAQIQQPPQQVQSMDHCHGNHPQGVQSSGHGNTSQQPQRQHRTLFDPYSSSQRPRKKGAVRRSDRQSCPSAAGGCAASAGPGGVKSAPCSPAASGKGRRRLHGADGNSSGGGSSNSGRHAASGGGGGGGGRGGKKKQRGTRYSHNGQHQHSGSGSGQHHHHHQQQNQPRPFNPVGKTGVMALHELCRKRHWEPPRFVEVEASTTQAQSSSQQGQRGEDGGPGQHPPPAATTVFPEFLMSVVVDGRELGRGRGGTKAAARQDASRRALLVLLPGIGFDDNGVLVGAVAAASAAAPSSSPSCPSPAWHPSEDLAPKLASGLAIDIDRGRDGDGGASSPAPSDDSSVRSVASSLASSSLASNGGVAAHKNGHPRRSAVAVYPSSGNATTTTSGGEDDDAYYASRGASVCSTLLHAMWQIDGRIGEPPTYEFDFVRPPTAAASNPPAPSAAAAADGRTIAVAPHRSSFECTASLFLRGGDGGDDGPRAAVAAEVPPFDRDGEPATRLLRTSASSREKDAVGTDQVASEKELACDVNMHGDTDVGTGASKDFGEATTYDGTRNNSTSGTDRTQLLKAVGTGATKREARHAASAKLLALLFPSCCGTVEVIAAAEQKREEYAASKARQSKQSKKRGGSGGGASSFSAKAAKRGGRHRSDFVAPAPMDPPLPVDVSRRIKYLSGLEVSTYCCENDYSTSRETLKGELQSSLPPSPKDTTVSSDNFISVENLSLSERNDDSAAQGENIMCARAKSPGNASTSSSEPGKEAEDDRVIGDIADVKEASIRQLARQRQLEDEVDSALQRLHELEDDGRASFGGLPGDDDVGKIVLRRATMDDSAWVAELLSMKAEHKVGGNHQDDKRRASHVPSPNHPSSALKTTLGPVALLSPFCSPSFPRKDSERGGNGQESLSDSAPLLWGGLSTILVLSRVFSGQNEPPLACAVLTVGFSLAKGRLLKISDMKHKEHLPRERFIECLEALASSMNCALEKTLSVGSASVSPSKMSPNDRCCEMSRNALTRIVESYTSAEFLVDSRSVCDRKQPKLPLVSDTPMSGTLQIAGMQQTLQSVKEEESGEEEKDVAATAENEKCNKASGQTQDKPSKRTRVS